MVDNKKALTKGNVIKEKVLCTAEEGTKMKLLFSKSCAKFSQITRGLNMIRMEYWSKLISNVKFFYFYFQIFLFSPVLSSSSYPSFSLFSLLLLIFLLFLFLNSKRERVLIFPVRKRLTELVCFA